MKNFSYYMPSRIFFGPGELNRLATEPLPGKKRCWWSPQAAP